MQEATSVQFGPFRLDGATGPLLRDGTDVKLRPKAMATLWRLASDIGNPVSKSDLVEAVWPGRNVSDGSLPVCIREIREALGDGAAKPHYVQTIHSYGYRLASAPRQNDEVVVDRDTELAQLTRLLTQARAGAPSVAVVTGEAGFGKTTLLNRWISSIDPSAQAQVVVGRCLEPTVTGSAYFPFLDALSQLANDRAPEAFSALLETHAPAWTMQFPALFADRSDLPRVAPNVDVDQMLRELIDLIAALSREDRLVLVLEDMHWCDEASAHVLAHLAHCRTAGPLVVVLTCRASDLIGSHHALKPILDSLKVAKLLDEIDLPLLSEDAVRDVVQARFGPATGADFSASLHARTDGHPMFVASLVDHLLDQGQPPTTESLANGSVPNDLLSFIELRLRDLNPDQRELLEIASTVGTVFSIAEINAAADGLTDRASLETQFDKLAADGTVVDDAGVVKWPDGTLTAQFAFRHAIYPEILRRGIASARRARMHEAIGLRLEAGFDADMTPVFGTLAYHFEQAKDAIKAVTYYSAAAKVDFGRHAYGDAASQIRRALALATSIADADTRNALELDLLLALGPMEVSIEGYGSDTVAKTFVRARELCDVPSLAGYRFPVLRGLAGFHILRSEYATTSELGEEILKAADRQNPDHDGQRLEALLMIGVADYFSGNQTAAEQNLLDATRLFDHERHADHAATHGLDPYCQALSTLALIQWTCGKEQDALRDADMALERAEAVDHPFSLSQTHAMLAFLHQMRNDLERTRAHSLAAATIAGEMAFPYIEASEHARQGWVEVQEGSVATGLAKIEKGIELYRETGATGGLTAILATLSEAHVQSGNPIQGLQCIEEALELAEARGEAFYLPELLRLRGEAVMATGPGSESAARDAFEQAIQAADDQNCEVWRKRSQERLAAL